MKTILLSAGHSLSEPGAVYNGTKENFLTIKLVEIAAEMLRKHGIGVLTVPDDLGLSDTIKYVNARSEQIDAAIDVHVNSGGGSGVEGWYYHNFSTGSGDAKSMNLAQCLVDAINVESGLPKRGIKDESTNRYGRLGFVHDTKPLAALIECGFIDNAFDLKLLTTDVGREKIARGIARGSLTAIGEQWRPDVISPPQTPNDVSELKKQIEELKLALSRAKDEYNKNLSLVKQECDNKVRVLKERILDILNQS